MLNLQAATIHFAAPVARAALPRPSRRHQVCVQAKTKHPEYVSPSSVTSSTELQRLEAYSTVGTRHDMGIAVVPLPFSSPPAPVVLEGLHATLHARQPPSDTHHAAPPPTCVVLCRWCPMCCSARACRTWRSPRRPHPPARCSQAS